MLKFLLINIILASLVFSNFDPSQYLYGGELPSSIQYENFSRGGTEYSIIVISGEPSFFLANGSLVNNSALAETIVTEYYREQYYLSDAELTELKELVELYNASRNNGARFKGKEEYICREGLFLEGISYGSERVTCDTEENCRKLSLVVYNAPFAEGIRRSFSIETFAGFMKAFSDATFGNDVIIDNDHSLIVNMNPGNARASLEMVQDSLSEIQENSDVIEASIFRTPRLNDDSDFNKCIQENCLGLCPDLDMNETYLEQLDSRIDTYLARIQPINNFETVADELNNNTNERIIYKQDTIEAVRLFQIFAPVESRAKQAISSGRTTESLIKNPQFSSQVARLATLVTAVNQSIQSKNFTSVLSNIEQVDELTQNVASQSAELLLVYNSALGAKGDADAALFLLEIRDISDDSEDRFVTIRNEISTLDAQFRSGLADSDYFVFSDKYQNASEKANILLQEERSKPITATVSKIRAFSRRVNHGINEFLTIAQLGDIPKTTDSRVFFGSIAFINFLSFTSLTIVLFVIAYRAFRPNKILISAIFAIMSVVLLVFSGLLFVYTEKTANNADLEEFLDEVARENITTVFVDVRGSDSPQTMLTCADRVALALETKNISTTVYGIDSNGCTEGGVPVPASLCSGISQKTTSFFMNFSNTYQKPTFKTVFQPHAYISGNTLTYKLCPLGLVLEG